MFTGNTRARCWGHPEVRQRSGRGHTEVTQSPGSSSGVWDHTRRHFEWWRVEEGVISWMDVVELHLQVDLVCVWEKLRDGVSLRIVHFQLRTISF